MSVQSGLTETRHGPVECPSRSISCICAAAASADPTPNSTPPQRLQLVYHPIAHPPGRRRNMPSLRRLRLHVGTLHAASDRTPGDGRMRSGGGPLESLGPRPPAPTSSGNERDTPTARPCQEPTRANLLGTTHSSLRGLSRAVRSSPQRGSGTPVTRDRLRPALDSHHPQLRRFRTGRTWLLTEPAGGWPRRTTLPCPPRRAGCASTTRRCAVSESATSFGSVGGKYQYQDREGLRPAAACGRPCANTVPPVVYGRSQIVPEATGGTAITSAPHEFAFTTFKSARTSGYSPTGRAGASWYS